MTGDVELGMQIESRRRRFNELLLKYKDKQLTEYRYEQLVRRFNYLTVLFHEALRKSNDNSAE